MKSVYWKAANTNIYINWYFHAPSNWKTGTLRNLIKIAKVESSTEILLRKEVDYIQKVFIENLNHIIDQKLPRPLQQKQLKLKTMTQNKRYNYWFHYLGNKDNY